MVLTGTAWLFRDIVTCQRRSEAVLPSTKYKILAHRRNHEIHQRKIPVICCALPSRVFVERINLKIQFGRIIAALYLCVRDDVGGSAGVQEPMSFDALWLSISQEIAKRTSFDRAQGLHCLCGSVSVLVPTTKTKLLSVNELKHWTETCWIGRCCEEHWTQSLKVWWDSWTTASVIREPRVLVSSPSADQKSFCSRLQKHHWPKYVDYAWLSQMTEGNLLSLGCVDFVLFCGSFAFRNFGCLVRKRRVRRACVACFMRKLDSLTTCSPKGDITVLVSFRLTELRSFRFCWCASV